MRSKLKEWDNRNERRIGKNKTYNGWTRRVQWFKGDDIRISFEDEDGKQNVIYTDTEKAQADWDAFKKGEITVQILWQR